MARKATAEEARFGLISEQGLREHIVALSVAYGCALESDGPTSTSARAAVAEWKDAAAQMYLRTYPVDVDDAGKQVARARVERGPLRDLERIKKDRDRRKRRARE